MVKKLNSSEDSVLHKVLLSVSNCMEEQPDGSFHENYGRFFLTLSKKEMKVFRAIQDKVL